MNVKTVVLMLIAIGCMVAASPLSPSFAMSGKEMKHVYGGVCKQACRSNAICSQEVSDCDGNCTGASDGAECGRASGTDKTTSWYCSGPIENGGGCHPTAERLKTALQCACKAEQCKAATTATDCLYMSNCLTD